ncbi:MAG TPA: DUF2892 domain-containing protein, partial [Thermoanaerobaculia bacterium]|nr:DUF2892 domain-containing protein [Thermoanaerobaculia bacterium]
MNTERYLRLIAGIVVLLSLAAGVWVSSWFFLVTALMGANLVQSAFTNWCPMMPVLRKLGVKDGAAKGGARGASSCGCGPRGIDARIAACATMA